MKRLIPALFISAQIVAASPSPDLQKEMATLRERIREAQLEVEMLRRELPEASDPEWMDLQSFVTRRLGNAEVTRASIEPTSLEDGRPSPVALCRMDISGRIPFENVQLLFDGIARVPRIIDFATFRLDAAPGGQVALRSRLAWVCWNSDVKTEPAVLGNPLTRVESVEERILAVEGAALARMQSIQKTIAGFKARFRPARLAHALSAFASTASHEALALTTFSATGSDVVIEGLTLGASAAAAVKPALEKTGAGNVTLQTTPAGDCRAFSVAANLTGEQPSVQPSSNTLFDDQAAVHCRQSPQPPPKTITVKGSTASADALTFRLREADVADVFRVLNEVQAGSFLIDADVKGMVNIDAEDATPEKILAAMGGLTIGPGPLHVVRSGPSASTAPGETSYTGEPISLTLKDAALNDVLCLFAGITYLKYIVPDQQQRRVTAYIRNIPWDRLLDTMLAAAGLTYTIDEDRVLIGSQASVDACEALDFSRRGLRISPDKISIDDLTLAGIARAASGRTAFAYTPGSSRTMLTLEPGSKLLDGEVSAVGPDGVTFKTATNKTVVVPMRP